MTAFETKNMERQFHITDVMSALFNFGFSASGVAGALSFISFMCKTDIHVWQFERAIADVKPFIFEQHPKLGLIPPPAESGQSPHEWIEGKIVEFGEYMTFRPVPHAEMLSREPFKEFIETLLSGAVEADLTIIPIESPDSEEES